jgi:structural maintenance of chromosome 4
LYNVRDYTTRRDEAKAKLEQEQSKMKEGEVELKALEKAYKVRQAEYDAVMKEFENANTNFAAYERKDLELQENMKHCRTQIDKVKTTVSRDLRKEEESVREAEEALILVMSNKDKIVEAERSKKEEASKLEEILEGLREATQTLRDSLEGTQAQLADAERATASIQVKRRGYSLIKGYG